MAIARICYITTCMGRLDMVQQTLDRVVGQPKSVCIVVDYSCPDDVGGWIESQFPTVQVIRVPGRSRFNLAHARKVGATKVPTNAEWLCFYDADIKFASEFATEVIPTLRTGHYYRPEPILNGTSGTFLVAKSDFERSGGFDELYQGYGGEDVDIYDNFAFLGLSMATFPGRLLEHLPHLDTERTRYYDEKNLWATIMVHRAYRHIKFDLMERTASPLPLDLRQMLYESIRPKVLTWYAGGSKGSLELLFRLRTGSDPDKTVRYCIHT